MKENKLLKLLFKYGADVSVESGSIVLANCDAVPEDVLLQVRECKQELITLIEKLSLSNSTFPKLSEEVKSGEYESPVTMAQESMLFMEELSEGKSYYNIPIAFRLNGPLNIAALSRSVDDLIHRNDVLRSKFEFNDSKYSRKIYEFEGTALQCKDLTVGVKSAAETIHIRLKEESEYLFDLLNEYPIRAVLFKVEEAEYVLSINIHHIAADGWSAKKIIGEISSGYKKHLNHSSDLDVTLKQQEFCYADYANWTDSWRDSKDFVKAEQFWLRELQGAPEIHSIATDFPRPAVLPVDGLTYTHEVPKDFVHKLENIAKEHKTSVFTVVQAAFAGLLSRYSGESDVVFGTAVANRKPEEFIETVGLFANTVALRYSAEQNKPFSDLLDQAKNIAHKSVRHQNFPFDALVNALCPVRSLSNNPIVQIMLVMQEDAVNQFELEGVDVELINNHQSVSKFDFTVHCFMESESPRFEWEFNTSLFSLDSIKSMAENFEYAINLWLQDSQAILGETDFLPECFNADQYKPLENTNTIHQLFLNSVKSNPSEVAVKDKGRAYSYAEIDKLSNNVAQYLHECFDGKAKKVAVCQERSVNLIVSMLGIYKQGSTYVPLDPKYPKERINFMVEDSSAELIIVDGIQQPESLLPPSKTVNISALLNLDKEINFPLSHDIDSPAYVIYTSGSTGAPKGVLVSHKSFCNSLLANTRKMNFSSNDIMPTVGSQAFGVSLLEILLPLSTGGTVEAIPKKTVNDTEELIHKTQSVTVFHAVPSLMQQWLDLVKASPNALYPNLRLLLVGGEAVPHELLDSLKAWRPDVRVLELYGMTESSVVCSSYEPTTEKMEHYCIGEPHANTRFYVLNKHLRMQPKGVPGELYIGGDTLAQGYINNPELTEKSFIDNPYIKTEKIYKTGDLVRCLHNGQHEFLGRIDNQVSLRGVRIELSEIESIVNKLYFINKSIAQVMTLEGGEKALVLFFVLVDDCDTKNIEVNKEVKEHLAKHLPDHMRPSVISLVDKFPLNPNGKIDRKKLALPSISTKYEEPASLLEKEILTIWESVLGRSNIGVTDNFFEIGGNSLMASKLVSKLRSKYEIDIPLKTLFEEKSVRACAVRIEKILKNKFAAELIISDQSVEFDFEELAI